MEENVEEGKRPWEEEKQRQKHKEKAKITTFHDFLSSKEN